MVTTKDDRYIFVSFGYGSLRKYSIKEQILKFDYGKIFLDSTIKAIVGTLDSRFLWVCGNKGCMVVIDIAKDEVVKDFGQVHEKKASAMACSGVYVFSSETQGHLFQWDIGEQALVKKYENAHNTEIKCLVVDLKNNGFWTGDASGYVKSWSIDDRAVVRDYKGVCAMEVRSMVITGDSEFVFIGDSVGGLFQISVADQ